MKLRVATLKDIDLMLAWAAEEGWNPGSADAQAFQCSDPQGFFVAEIAGDPVAAISVVNHSDDMAFLGLYICRADHRGRGIGYALWQHALRHAGPRTVGLDGVADQQQNYAKSGFVRTGATIRFQGHLTGVNDPSVRPAAPDDQTGLLALDSAANGFTRDRFLNEWVMPRASRQTVVLCHDGQITGFATLRSCGTGAKLGPIIANSCEEGLTLARAALAAIPSTPVIIDVPSGNTRMCTALQALGFVETFSTARMYCGPAPVMGPSCQAIATMELG